MLSTNTENNLPIINTIITFHRTGSLLPDAPPGVVQKGNNLHIAYGFNDEKKELLL